jgi:hypothetical protein
MAGFSSGYRDETQPFDYGMLYTDKMKNRWVGGYLNSPDNTNKNFVQRINTMNDGTSLSRPSANGGHENLRMANDDNRVFPTIESRDGELRTLERHEQPQEYIETTTPEQAQILAWNEYKRNNPAFGYGNNREPSLLDQFTEQGFRNGR